MATTTSTTSSSTTTTTTTTTTVIPVIPVIPIPAWASDTVATRMHHYALALSKLNEFEIQFGVGETLDDISYDRWMRRREKVVSCRTKFASALDSSFPSRKKLSKKPGCINLSRHSLAVFWLLCICINRHYFPSVSWFAPKAFKRTSKTMRDIATRFWWVINLSSGAWQVSLWCRALFLSLIASVSISMNPKPKPGCQLQQSQSQSRWRTLGTIIKNGVMEPCTAGCFLLGRFKDRKSELERLYPEIRNLKNIPPVQYVAYVDELERFTARKLAGELLRMKVEREEMLKTTEMVKESLLGVMKGIRRQKIMLNEVRGGG
ncbi:Protein of unknown function [Pyronema omphalodes CBS 100304]|uniref:Uncharacterized protein n=1 Tax=Pyronema omphalodes (strain CBS 100304) TaxID=1076935 RepID=U4LBM1_PYROM|nr:Protein of unknown function [Pyronema omphalodes CBS 100304]